MSEDDGSKADVVSQVDVDGLNTYLVIGGEGFLGHRILQDLHERYGSRCKLFSSSRSRRYTCPNWPWIRCDLTSADSIRDVLEQTGAKTVFLSAASHFDSSMKDALAINVQGTKATVEACRRAGVRRLILSSTTAVIFSGAWVEDATEETPYLKDAQHKTPYTLSKSMGEQLAIQANGKDGLHVTAIRLNAIIGRGDQAVMSNIIPVLKHHQGWIQIGANKNLCEFDHVRNVSLGHILACEHLLDPDDHCKPGNAAGQVFNITGGREQALPIFTFLRKVWKEYNGYEARFNLVIPFSVAWVMAEANEAICAALGVRALGINRAALQYATAARWHNIDKAKRLLGYEPVFSQDDAIREAVQYYKEEEAKEAQKAAARKASIPDRPLMTQSNLVVAYCILWLAIIAVYASW